MYTKQEISQAIKYSIDSLEGMVLLKISKQDEQTNSLLVIEYLSNQESMFIGYYFNGNSQFKLENGKTLNVETNSQFMNLKKVVFEDWSVTLLELEQNEFSLVGANANRLGNDMNINIFYSDPELMDIVLISNIFSTQLNIDNLDILDLKIQCVS